MHQDTSVRHVFDRSVNAQFERFIPCALTEENALYNSADSDLCMDLFHWEPIGVGCVKYDGLTAFL